MVLLLLRLARLAPEWADAVTAVQCLGEDTACYTGYARTEVAEA